MSRKPSIAKPGTMARSASTVGAMAPPSRIPSRGTATTNGHQESESRSNSPTRKVSGKRTISASATSNTRGVSGETGEINIQVVVRCRGRSNIELQSASPIITTTQGPLGKQIMVETTPTASSTLATFTTASSYGAGGSNTKTYPFDKVFGPEADQTMVFREVAEGMLDEVLQGYNCTIFAYGQTGTGKTYTMQGDMALSPLSAPKDEAGIVPRVLHRLFSLLEGGSYLEYSVKCSYVELYNEELRDLLSAEYDPVTAGQRQPMARGDAAPAGGGLKLYEDGKKGVMIQGLEEVGVKNLKESLGLLDKGCQRRQVAETKMNTESSRSHTVFSVTVHVKEQGLTTENEDVLRVGKFNLVDLAGSEAIGRSGATDKRAREAGMINQSLLTLGRVISALVEKGSHIPYRESKLTRLLQDSLGGRTKTCIVATVSPTRSNMEETLSTLDYAIRAKSIRNRPEINAHLTKTGLLKEYLGDIERLKAEVLAAREKNGIYIPEEQWREMHEMQGKLKSEYEEAKLRANAASVELSTKKKEFDELSVKMLATTAELEEVREAERQLNDLMETMKAELDIAQQRLEEEAAVSHAYEHGEERVDRVARDLRGVAEESVSDVGGLFEKLARRAQVLGANADSATRFGADMQTLAKELKHGLQKLHSVQDKMGQQLQADLADCTARGHQASRQDVAELEKSLAVYQKTAEGLIQSIEAGRMEAAEAGETLLRVRDEVKGSVRQWARGVSDKSTEMVQGLLAHQEEHLSMVSTVLDSTADLVDAVISTSRQHLADEAAAWSRVHALSQTTSQAEITRLRSQNALLAKLLVNEKAKTAALRTDLISNLTGLIVGFTDAQDASLTSAVSQVVAASEQGVVEMQRWDAVEGEAYAESSTRARRMESEMVTAAQTVTGQRRVGRSALTDVQDGMRSVLEGYGEETRGMALGLEELSEGWSGTMQGVASSVADTGVERAKAQSQALADLSVKVQEFHDASKSRSLRSAEDIQAMSSSLISLEQSASQAVTKAHSSTTQSLDALVQSTGVFLATGISEDVPTGITPKKKVWNVTQSWERTEPRERIIAQLRERQGGTPAIISFSPVETEGHDTLPLSESMASVAESNGTSESSPPVMAQPLSGLPTPNAVSASQMKAQSRSKLAMLAGGVKTAAVLVEEKRQVAPLGEGGINVPRRVRK